MPYTPEWAAWRPAVIERKGKPTVHVVGTGKLPLREKAAEDRDRCEWHMRRYFGKTVAAILSDGWGMGRYYLVGNAEPFEPMGAVWTYEPYEENA